MRQLPGEKPEEIITWNDVKRSEEPCNWKRMLDRMTLTHEKLNKFLAEEIRKLKENK